MRIVCLFPALTEVLVALGAGDAIVAVDESDAADGLSESLPRVEIGLIAQPPPYLTYNPKPILDARPDQILYDPTLAIDSFPDGVATLAPNPKSLAEIYEMWRELAALTRTDASALIETTRATLRLIGSITAPQTPKPRVLALSGIDEPTGAFVSCGGFVAELLALSGATPGPWETPNADPKRLTTEEIDAFSPEIVLFSGRELIDADLSSPETVAGFNQSLAVLAESTWFPNAEFYAVDGGTFLFQPSPRLPETARILATILHPQLFPDMLPAYSVAILNPGKSETSKAK